MHSIYKSILSFRQLVSAKSHCMPIWDHLAFSLRDKRSENPINTLPASLA